ncbi:ArsR family transcriptional regulator [Staphylococcus cohnii]|uniref:ArsR family transcriptional regulator n=1 Tax=Staphylococcus cohnii TaxID=29382 RepID=A0A2T4LPT2_9STAP|nr:metalloregulator ArsR/SmtB family transcription factor [Staphylococcus cohnii]PTF62846.1 ArsR family transcriptional regulator [Staphylococcus cohnii]
MEVIKAKTDMNEDQQLDFYENMFNTLADKNRLKILNQISQSPNKSLCVCDLEELLDLKQSKISYHLKKLVSAQILIPEKYGTWNYYKINEAQIQVVLTEDTCCKIL